MTKRMEWDKLISYKRYGKDAKHSDQEEYRTQFQRDFDRLIFSAPFRRMQNKTQVFPLPGSVFVHNRLTHSLEVSSVGRSLGIDVARELQQKYPHIKEDIFASFGAIVSAACLAHDMGNPPFGHSGEKAITSYFSEGAGAKLEHYVDKNNGSKLSPAQWEDMINFDGNANTFRLLTHQFKGRRKGGFVMTYSTLASIVKYPYSSTLTNGKPKFGFFEREQAHFVQIANDLGMICQRHEGGEVKFARHPLVFLVEAADDICYEIMDIEDAHKLRLLSDEETFELLFAFFSEENVAEIKKVFELVTDVNERIVYLRSSIINALEHACVKVFLDHEEDILAGTFSDPLIDHIEAPLCAAYKACERVAYDKIYGSKDVVDVDLSGYHIIFTLLDLFINAVLAPDKAYSKLLISGVSSQYELDAPALYDRILAVLDYISGMTDVYALDVYRKIKGMSLPNV